MDRYGHRSGVLLLSICGVRESQRWYSSGKHNDAQVKVLRWWGYASLGPLFSFYFSYLLFHRCICNLSGEKVLCFHGPLIYEAKCLKSSVSKEKHIKYLIHYAGWNKKYVYFLRHIVSNTLVFVDVHIENLQKPPNLTSLCCLLTKVIIFVKSIHMSKTIFVRRLF